MTIYQAKTTDNTFESNILSDILDALKFDHQEAKILLDLDEITDHFVIVFSVWTKQQEFITITKNKIDDGNIYTTNLIIGNKIGDVLDSRFLKG